MLNPVRPPRHPVISMCERGPRRRWLAAVVVTAVLGLGGSGVIAWVRRTAPPWPSVVGTAFEIPLGPDGCPTHSDGFYPDVDAPGELVPPGATEVTLCIRRTEPSASPLGFAKPLRQRVLRSGAAEFAAWLNQLPDRNAAWRQIQREESGWWPDAAPLLGEVCLLSVSPDEYSFVLRYATVRRCRWY
ncbi:hypothetical protein AB0M36_15995 [Actinoplanes sp. NPDC051346]|uniref:hypothetical protein n=1 Tax=Actinoplanes sp. NPDC051346 TaxID=3155048 RepID=UPI00343F6193